MNVISAKNRETSEFERVEGGFASISARSSNGGSENRGEKGETTPRNPSLDIHSNNFHTDELVSNQKAAERQRQKAEVIKKLERANYKSENELDVRYKNDPDGARESKDGQGVRSALKLLRGCKHFVTYDGGQPQLTAELCRSKHCPYCRNEKQRKERNELRGVVAIRARAWEKRADSRKRKANLGLLTLTQKAYEGLRAKEAYGSLRKTWGKLTKTREYKGWVVEGFAGCYTVEMEDNPNGGWIHAHMHVLVEIPASKTLAEMRSELASVWTRVGGGFIMDLQPVKDEFNAIMEVTKYVTKDISKSDDALAEIIEATYKKRLRGYFGKNWIDARVEAEVEIEAAIDEAEVPEEPCRISRSTGEMASLPDGTYTIPQLVSMASRGIWGAQWTLLWIKYERALKRDLPKTVADYLKEELGDHFTLDEKAVPRPVYSDRSAPKPAN